MSTQVKATVNDVLQIMADLRGESTINTDASRIRAVSRAEQAFALQTFFRIHRLENQTLIADGTSDFTIGTATYPYRAKGLAELFVNGTTEDRRYRVLDKETYIDQFNRNNSLNIAYEWYDDANDLWKIHYTPAADVGKTITYTYYYSPPTRTATTDPVVSYNTQVLAHLALAEIYHGEDEIQKSQLSMQLAASLVNDALAVENTPAHGQTYAMGAIENSQFSRGIGTY